MEKLRVFTAKQKIDNLLHSRKENQTWKEFEKIKPNLEGKTILVILDGNRRYATKLGLEEKIGHAMGAKTAKELARFLLSLKMNVVFWGFSPDNWQRDPDEIKNIFHLANSTLEEFTEEMNQNNVRIKHLGAKDKLPQYLINTIQISEQTTESNSGPFFQFALDYSGRDEIDRAATKVLQGVINGSITLNPNDGTLHDSKMARGEGKTFFEYIKQASDDEGEAYEIDLVVRPGGEKRLSAFGSRADYSEQFFLDKKFPELTSIDFAKVLVAFSKKDRRFGGNSKS